MKINAKLLLITFLIVVLVSVASTLIYHSLANKLIQNQQNEALLYSTNNLAFRLENALEKANEEFRSINNYKAYNGKSSFGEGVIDFIFTLHSDSLLDLHYFRKTKSLSNSIRPKTINQFIKNNPNVIFNFHQKQNSAPVFYGIIVSEKFLNDISTEINADVSLLIEGKPYVASSRKSKNNYLNLVNNAMRGLKLIKEGSVFREEMDNEDFLAAEYTPKEILTPNKNISFLVYTISPEAHEFRARMRLIFILLVSTGVLLSLILILLFTTKLRKQINLLSEAAEITGGGDMEHRVNIVAKDEIGKLGIAFNGMLDELASRKKAEKEYTELITLINENPTLSQVSDAALLKILNATNLTLGLMYLIDKSKFRLLSSFGVDRQFLIPSQQVNFYKNAIERKAPIEFIFEKNNPIVKTGTSEIKIEYLLITPIIYNKKVIAVLELASNKHPEYDIKNYLANIHDQLAIGLMNAHAFEQSENLVQELKLLNEDYHNQNNQMTKQNKRLIALHNQLSKRTQELEEQREKAIESTRVKSQFLATMSHELRTPLSSILGLSELVLKEKDISKKTRERMNIVSRNGRRLLNIITNILEFSKLDYGKIEIKKEHFILADFIKQISNYAEPLIYEKNLQFTIEYPTNVEIMLSTDRSKLEQIVHNLLSNAIKFTEEGSVKLRISLVGETGIEFQVTDTGIGISDKDKQIIFEEFRQVDAGAARKYGGAGLGLAICKRYVDLLQGSLNVKSALGNGTEFTMVLPNAIVSNTEKTVSSAESNKTVENKLIYGKEIFNQQKKVLFVGKQRTSTKNLIKYLHSYEIQTTIVEDTKTVISAAKEFNPDLISIDVDVSDSNGWLVLLELKKNHATKRIPIILTSQTEDGELFYEIDACGYVFKNDNVDEYLLNINNIERDTRTKIKKIISVDFTDGSFEELSAKLKGEIQIENVFVEDDIYEKVYKENPDLLILNLIGPEYSELSFIQDLKQNLQTRDIPYIIRTSKNIEAEEVIHLTNTIKRLTRKAQLHPLDLLKILRKRLNFEIDSDLNEKLFSRNSRLQVIDHFESDANKSRESKPTVLIVDDDEDTLFTVSEIVRNLGYETLFAKNGIECLLTLDKIRPDLILLDIMMPQMDGFETIHKIRKDKMISDLPVFALTAHAMLEEKETIEKNGFDDIITKPIDTSVLAVKVGKVLKKKSA